MDHLRYLKKLLRALYYRFIHLFSYLVPKDQNTWIFIGWRKNKDREIFAENPKYLYLYANQHESSIRPIWIGMDSKICSVLTKQGYEAYPFLSLKGIWFSLRSGYTFIGAMMPLKHWSLSGGSRVIQLWHGKSFKKTGHNSPYSLQRYERFLNPNLFCRFYKFIGVSEFLAKFTVQDFQVPQDKMLITGIPKYDALLNRNIKGAEIDHDVELDKLLDQIKNQGSNRIIFYGPTFRPDGKNPLEQIDLVALNDTLRVKNDYVILSLHPKFAIRDWIPKDTDLSNIYLSQGDTDIYPLLPKFDALITDYSSLATDFFFMGKPVIFFTFDFKTYNEKMGVYEEIWSLLPEPKIYTFDELLTVLKQPKITPSEEIKRIRDNLFNLRDSEASKRIVDFIKSQRD